MKLIIGITGASGGIYAASLLQELSKRKFEIHAVASPAGRDVLRFECELGPEDFPDVVWHKPDNMFSSLASGSARFDVMVVVPCSMNTLGCIACGISNNLLQRAAAVMLKEKRRLIVVPRETPLSTIHLKSMLALDRAGACILPASPGFYHRPQTVEELVNHVTGKILDQFGIPHELFVSWKEPDVHHGGSSGSRERNEAE